MAGIKKYLLLFAQDFVEFRYPEIESLIKLFKISVKVPKVVPFDRPYWILDANESDITKLASRSVSIKLVAEIYASGENYDEFHNNAKNYTKFIDENYKSQSFKFIVETYNKHITLSDKIQKIETMNYLDKSFGTIDLQNPTNKLLYFEFFGMDHENVPEFPEEIIFGRWLADGQRHLINTISLKTRKFIGNTSMNPHLSILMANQGLSQANELMFDPFCGTGSCIISSALFGSYVMGMDISYLTLHGLNKPTRAMQKVRSVDENIRANMNQYNLQHLFLDVFIGDFSNCPLKDDLIFDAIICDPPYGVREAISKIEKKERRKQTAMTEDAVHFPSLSTYTISNLYHDLLNFSTKHLKMFGRLVCWFPISEKNYNEDNLPLHSAMRLISHSKQQLVGETGRVLLTYEKISDNGEMLNKDVLEDIDFRLKYFEQIDETKKARQKATFERNRAEADKRGIKLVDKAAWKRHINKKRAGKLDTEEEKT